MVKCVFMDEGKKTGMVEFTAASCKVWETLLIYAPLTDTCFENSPFGRPTLVATYIVQLCTDCKHTYIPCVPDWAILIDSNNKRGTTTTAAPVLMNIYFINEIFRASSLSALN